MIMNISLSKTERHACRKKINTFPLLLKAFACDDPHVVSVISIFKVVDRQLDRNYAEVAGIPVIAEV